MKARRIWLLVMLACVFAVEAGLSAEAADEATGCYVALNGSDERW